LFRFRSLFSHPKKRHGAVAACLFGNAVGLKNGNQTEWQKRQGKQCDKLHA
jgi:hypothetical protein